MSNLINNADLFNILGVPSTSAEYQFAETTLRVIIKESATFADLYFKAGREAHYLNEEGRTRTAELFDNLAFWAWQMDNAPRVGWFEPGGALAA